MSLSCPQGWRTYTPSHRVNSTVLLKRGAGPALLRATADEGLGQVLHLLQVSGSKGRRASFPHPCHHTAHKRGMQVCVTTPDFVFSPFFFPSSSFLSIVGTQAKKCSCVRRFLRVCEEAARKQDESCVLRSWCTSDHSLQLDVVICLHVYMEKHVLVKCSLHL